MLLLVLVKISNKHTEKDLT